MAQKIWVIIIVVCVVGLGVGYWVGYSKGDGAGYKRAEADVKKLQDESAKKASEAAAKAANPFQAVNPLGAVEANPFEKTKKILNPFN